MFKKCPGFKIIVIKKSMNIKHLRRCVLEQNRRIVSYAYKSAHYAEIRHFYTKIKYIKFITYFSS